MLLKKKVPITKQAFCGCRNVFFNPIQGSLAQSVERLVFHPPLSSTYRNAAIGEMDSTFLRSYRNLQKSLNMKTKLIQQELSSEALRV